MPPRIRATTLVFLAAAALSGSAFAEQARRTSGKAFVQAPIKDCTRHNGRIGYYGNPWCTPAEQLRWDKWDAQRASRR
ncbi:MAG TPA: hypothetical protein VEA77_00470 [Hyphomicrobium sp.]|nr:hypothetical protein [Hyphomicrobium sp.]